MNKKSLEVFWDTNLLDWYMMSTKLNESQKMACNLLATGMKTSDILSQLKIRPETLSRWKQNEEFIRQLKKTQEKILENIKKDDIFNYNLELKNLDILFKKIENDN